MSIQRVTLGSVTEEVDYGLTASATEHDTGVKFLRITDIQDDIVDWHTVPYCSCSFEEAQKHRLETGDIVFARTGATTGKSYLINEFPEGAVFASYLIRVRPKRDTIDPVFLSYFFRSSDYWEQISGSVVGAAQLGFNATKLKGLVVPLPPIVGQQRVAAVLARADRLRRLRRYALDLGDGYLQSVFLEMFGDPVTNPMGWKRVTVGDVVASSQYGTSNKSNSEQRGYPVLGMGNITYSGQIDLASLSCVELSEDEFRSLHLVPGDIIFNRTNSTELVGKTAHWTYEFDAVLASYLVKLKLKNSVLSEYFTVLLNTEYYKRLFQKRCKKAVGQSNVSPTLLREFPMLMPPIPLQQQFARVVRKAERLRAQQREAQRQAEHLFQALLHRAFRGEM
ncbi:MAG: restriction endonuclease subunit S [Anaerolineae bacterium]|nr:restriction endonuclease subunit S [Anaerolineae bacterium]